MSEKPDTGPEEVLRMFKNKRSRPRWEHKAKHRQDVLPIIQKPDLDRNSQLIGRRFLAARKLSGMEQIKAAPRLGFKGSSALCKIESGESCPGFDTIFRASMLYGVSSDYLMGLSDFPERDGATIEQLAISRHFRQMIEEGVIKSTKAAIDFAGDSVSLIAHLVKLRERTGDVFKAMCQMGGTAPDALSAAVNALVEEADASHQYLRRRKMLNGAAYLDEIEESQRYPLLAVIREQVPEVEGG